ncbi:MAG: exosortase/archaeosortase family protein [Verrucomicrobiota bacterium]
MRRPSVSGYSLAGIGLTIAFLLCRACAPEWTVNPQYGYGWYIPFFVIYLIRERFLFVEKNDFLPALSRGTLGIVFVLFLCALMLEWIRLQHPPMRLVMGMQGGVWILFLLTAWGDYSSSFRKALIFPGLLLLTAIPWPTRIEEPLTRILMSWVTGFAVEILHLSGVVAHREGDVIVFPHAMVGVSEACSGIRSLQAVLVFSLIFGEWRRGRFSRRIELVIVGFILALSGNLLRTLSLSWIASQRGMDVMEQNHDRSGWLLLVFLIGGMGAWSIWRMPVLVQNPKRENFISSWKHRRSFGMTLILGFGLLLGLGMNMRIFLQNQNGELRKGSLIEWRSSSLDRKVSIPSEVWRNLRAISGEWIESPLKDFEGGRLEYYHFDWGAIRDSQGVRLHRPDWCMNGIGWKRLGVPRSGELRTENGILEGYWIEYQRPGENALQFWTLLRNGERVEIHFDAPALVEDFSWKNFVFPHEPSSTWEMISIAVSSPLMMPDQKQIESIAGERIHQSK